LFSFLCLPKEKSTQTPKKGKAKKHPQRPKAKKKPIHFFFFKLKKNHHPFPSASGLSSKRNWMTILFKKKKKKCLDHIHAPSASGLSSKRL
jgi:hypothetical protein